MAAGRGAGAAIVATIALTMTGLVLAGRPAAPGNGIADHLPDQPTTRLHTDLATGAPWQVNQGVLPASAAWDELSLLARRHQQPADSGHWLTVDMLDPATPAGRFSLDFQVDGDTVTFRALTMPGRSLSLDPGIPVLDPEMLDGADLDWQGTLSQDDTDPQPATAHLHAAQTADGCVETRVDLDAGASDTFTWCTGDQVGLVGWTSERTDGTTGFTPAPASRTPPDTAADLDETPAGPLTGEPVLPVEFFRVIAGAYREQLPPHGSRATWVADQLVIADTEGRVTSWLPLEDEAVDGASSYTQIWRAQPGGSVRALLAVGAITLLGTTDREVVAYDRDGWELWRLPVHDGVTQMSAVADTVLVLDAGSDLTAVDPISGEQRWAVAGVDELLATDADRGTLVALGGTELAVREVGTGAVSWSVQVDPRDVDVAVVGEQVSITTGSWLVTRDRATGAVSWARAVPSDTLLSSTGAALLVSEPRTARILDAAGAPVWSSGEPMPIALALPGDGVLGVMREGLLLAGPDISTLTWSYPDNVQDPDLDLVRGDLGIITVQLEDGYYRWWEYR